MSEISGLHELDARIAALHWIARSVDMPPDVARRIVAMAEVFAEARGMVARDYVAAPEAERDPSTQASPLPPVAQAVVDAPDDDAAPEEPARWDKPLAAPPRVIRKWAQAQGITCPAGGLLSAALLNIINDRRRMLRLRPFVQAAAPAGDDA
jgi:hypothetical protein